MQWDPAQLTVQRLLVFLEFLVASDFSFNQISNYLSGIKAMAVIHGLSDFPFSHVQVKYFVRSLQITNPITVTLKKIIDIPLLRRIVHQCDQTYMGQVFKAIYLTAFFSFLRLSNFVPHALAQFSAKKHLTKEDIFFQANKAIILVKWSKTLQTSSSAKLIHLPRLGNDICPVVALQNVLTLVPQAANSPLFQYKTLTGWQPLTDSRVRSHLASVLQSLGLSRSHISFHSFRRSGATFAFNHNVPLQDIKHHGTWTSDCVWRYVTDSVDAGSRVADTFSALLS